MSFTDFQLKNLSGKVAPNFVGLDNYVQIVQSQLNIPNFEFLRLLFFNLFWAFSNVVIHVVMGVGVALLLNVPRASGSSASTGRSSSSRRHPADHRRDGLAEHVRPGAAAR